MTRTAAGISAVLLGALALLPAPAQADSAYRYWSYWIGGDQWSYSARGPGFRVPPADSVEGWRFVVSPKDGSQAVAPAGPAGYAALCPGQPPAPAGQKRVAVVIDPGPPGIAPVGDTPGARSVKCVVAGVNDTGLQVLQKVAGLRFHSSGLICGIAGFPTTECPGQSTTAVNRSAATPTVDSAAAPEPIAPAATPTTAATNENTPRPATKAPDPTPTATPSVPVRTQPSPAPSVVALSLGEDAAAPTSTNPPAWIAAIGAVLVLGLFALAFIARRNRS